MNVAFNLVKESLTKLLEFKENVLILLNLITLKILLQLNVLLQMVGS